MELFERARTVRLRSHHDKYLYADDDEAHVIQDHNAASPNARWVVEPVPHSPGVLRLRSRYGRYLSASNKPFLLGALVAKCSRPYPTASTPPSSGCPSATMAAVESVLVVRASAPGLPPWRNSVTHDTPHQHAGWVVWDVEIVQSLLAGPDSSTSASDAGSTESFSVLLHKVEGWAIHYHIGDDDGDVSPDEEPNYLTFNGTSLEELLEMLKEETGL
ncbi:uncharacterized protein C2845_PM03G22380 [Panicum miliaceum]|uniref:DUF569 domain-containing protein n=1 Tax=Panicum miliaceum TaxID=4540 RepID=A0A3L6T9D5_PANMI|nr:uncharacterized protein C2845_PM03G22380 [Panicum miliaceum]